MSYYVIPEIEQALIIFAQYPQPGHVKPMLCAEIGESAAARVYEAMLMQQLQSVAGMEGLSPYVFYTPDELMDEIEEWLSPFSESIAMAAQMGESRGERMFLAFKRIFSRNTIRKAIFIAEDCPQLDESVIKNAFSLLDESDFVIGPGEDGGCYLFGMKSLQQWAFDEVPWDEAPSVDVIAAVIEAHQCSFRKLSELRIVNTAQDLDSAWPGWRVELA